MMSHVGGLHLCDPDAASLNVEVNTVITVTSAELQPLCSQLRTFSNHSDATGFLHLLLPRHYK